MSFRSQLGARTEWQLPPSLFIVVNYQDLRRVHPGVGVPLPRVVRFLKIAPCVGNVRVGTSAPEQSGQANDMNGAAIREPRAGRVVASKTNGRASAIDATFCAVRSRSLESSVEPKGCGSVGPVIEGPHAPVRIPTATLLHQPPDS